MLLLISYLTILIPMYGELGTLSSHLLAAILKALKPNYELIFKMIFSYDREQLDGVGPASHSG